MTTYHVMYGTLAKIYMLLYAGTVLLAQRKQPSSFLEQWRQMMFRV